MIGYWILGIVAVFLQTVFVWPFLPTAVVLLVAVRQPAQKSYLLAFIVGVLSDLLLGRFLGVTAVYLILVALSVYGYKLRGKINWLAVFILLLAWELIAKFLWG